MDMKSTDKEGITAGGRNRCCDGLLGAKILGFNPLVPAEKGHDDRAAVRG